MSIELDSERVSTLPEIPPEEILDLNEQSFEDYTEFEELSYGLSEEVSDEYSGYSIFTDVSIETYKTRGGEEEAIPYDPLISVPPEDYPDMLFLMGNDFPKAIHAYEHVRALIKWKKLCPKQEIHILAPAGDYKNGIFFFRKYHGNISSRPWNLATRYLGICYLEIVIPISGMGNPREWEDGTFPIFGKIHWLDCDHEWIQKYPESGNFYGSAYCHENTDKSILDEALANSRYLPIQDHYNLCRITCLNPNTYEAIEPIFSNGNWCSSKDVVMWLPWYCAREMEVHLPNKEVQIRKLDLEHIDLIHESWQQNFPGSRELLGDMFDVSEGLGLFEDDSLLSWALVWYHGGIGIIQTIEREKRKGYCRPVVEALTKKMGECLIDVHLKITRGKKRDIVFFSGLGFRIAFKAITYETKKNEDQNKFENKMDTMKN